MGRRCFSSLPLHYTILFFFVLGVLKNSYFISGLFPAGKSLLFFVVFCGAASFSVSHELIILFNALLTRTHHKNKKLNVFW